MTTEDLLARLDGVRPSGAGWAARCPAHDDSHPSLSVRIGDKGCTVLKCHSGCEMPDIVTALGLRMADLFDDARGTDPGLRPPTSAPAAADSGGRVVARYPYVDEGGVLLYEKIRKEPKAFYQVGADGSTRLDGVRRVLYRLPAVLQVVKAGGKAGAIYVTEGEKGCEALVGIGIAGATCPGGAKAWRPEFTEVLRGAALVVMLPDNDEPGRCCMTEAAKALHAMGVKVKVPELPELPEKGDVADWIAGGGTKAKLFELAKAAALWTPAEREAHEAREEEAWSVPLPLRASALVPPFPVDVLPGPVRAIVEAEALSTQTPPDLAAFLAIGCLSTVCARRVAVRVADDWCEPVNVYSLVCLGSGNRKSAVLSDLAAPLFVWERDEAARLAPEIQRSALRREMLEGRKKAATAAAVKAAAEELADREHDALQATQDLDAEPIVRAPRLVADDVTPEKLAVLLAEHGERLGVLSAEGGLFGILAGRYSDKAPNLDLVLKAHSGDSCAVDRITREPIRLAAPALTLALAIQRDVLEGASATREFRGRGLLARFLYAVPASLVGARSVETPSVPAYLRDRWRGLLYSLLALPALPTPGDAPELRLDPAALSELQAFRVALEPRLGPGGSLEHFADWGSKLPGQTLRLAGLFHMATGRPDPLGHLVDHETMAAAIRLAADYLIPHALAALGAMAADPVLERAEVVLQYLHRDGRAEVSERDIFRGVSSAHIPTMDALRPALQRLEALDYLRPAPLAPRTGGRPPAPRLRVNPLRPAVRQAVPPPVVPQEGEL